MADKKISQLTNITGASVNDSADELPIVDSFTNETKAITRAELFQSVGDASFGNLTTTGNATLGTDGALTGGAADGLNVVGASNGLLAKFGGNNTVYDRALQINEFAVGGTNNVGFQFNAQGNGTVGELRFAVAGTDVITINDDFNVLLPDNTELRFGDSGDLTIKHNATNGVITNNTNHLYLANAANDKDVYIQSDDGSGGITSYFAADGSVGSANLYYYGAQKLATNSTGVSVNGNISLGDGDRLNLGASNDLALRHDGTNNNIDSETGILYITQNVDNQDVIIRSDDGSGGVTTYLRADGSNGETKLYHYGSEKFSTKSTGVNVFGLVTCNTLDVSGALSKGSGSFKIDHPLKPETHHLVHSFVEAPQADNIYRGKVTLVDGSATVNLDEAGRMTEGTFVLLNGNIQCFTSNEDGWTAIRGSVSGNTLTIQAQDASCADTVSWLVIGERHDQHMIDTGWTDEAGRVITEPEKQTEEDE